MISISKNSLSAFAHKKDTALRQCLYVAGFEPAVILIR